MHGDTTPIGLKQYFYNVHSQPSLVPRPPPSAREKGLVNIDTFLGFVGGLVYLISYGSKINLHSDGSSQKCRQFNKSHSKRKPAL